jgi:hypothetical protein
MALSRVGLQFGLKLAVKTGTLTSAIAAASGEATAGKPLSGAGRIPRCAGRNILYVAVGGLGDRSLSRQLLTCACGLFKKAMPLS